MRMFVAAAALLALTACSDIVRYHGYTPSDEDLSFVAVGKDDRDSVLFKVGRPSSAGLMADGAWYYVQSRWVTHHVRAPEEVERQVLAISFDAGGKVSNIERFTLEDGRVVPLSRRVTDTNIEGIGFIRQMLGNVGRMDASQFLK